MTHRERRNKRAAWCGIGIVGAIIIGFLLALLLPAVVHGQEHSVTVSVRSQYLGTNGSSFYGGPVVHPEVTWALSPSFSLNVWVSQGLDNSEYWEDFDDEVDLTLFYTKKVGEFDLTFTLGYFALVSVVPGDVVNPIVEASRAFEVSRRHTLSPFAATEAYFPTEGGDPKEGWMQRLGVRHNWTLSDRFSISTDAHLFYDSGAFDFEEGVIAWLQTGLNTSLTKRITLTAPFLRCASGVTVDDRGSDCAVGTALSTSF